MYVLLVMSLCSGNRKKKRFYSEFFLLLLTQDLMDSDDLLVEEDLLKPDPATLRSKHNFSSLLFHYLDNISYLNCTKKIFLSVLIE